MQGIRSVTPRAARRRPPAAWLTARWERVPPVYRPSAAYMAMAGSGFAAVYACIGWIFFEQWIACALLAGAGVAAALGHIDEYARGRKRTTAAHFEQLLFALASSLQAGKSIENAFREAEADLLRMYGEGRSPLVAQLQKLNRMTDNGIPLERGVTELQRELDLEEIRSWADMFCTCRRTGGDLVKVMRQTSRTVVEKMNMERELAVMIAGKRFEAKALAVVPFLIVGMFRYGSPDYMEPLYAGQGRLVMLAALLLLAAGKFVADRLMRLEV